MTDKMASPYNGYTHDPVQRAPSPYQPQYGPDPTQGAPSPYTPSPYEQGSSNGYYDQHPQANGQAYNNQGDQQYNGRQPQYDGAPGAEGEKGLLGAFGGGIGGHLIGKQTCHGFIGTVGGAIMGSLTEDWAKRKKPLCGRPTTPTCVPQQPACPPAGPVYSPPIYDTHTNVATTTHIHPGSWQAPPPVYPQTHPGKPCGHQQHCGCSFYGKH
ncbi:hypothetical protein LTR99_011165 [Exophiala xenobiotica]|nr:hypothetical protein LTR99_011165 [Exophiala xenobiotica]KAK5425372.1 hypothetical protein LTR34_011178 [Exophiala xenobiotica]KAK5528172.1 hypothetical protein LTR23_011104 [Chaetothyriales sp. CCFEE 6169]